MSVFRVHKNKDYTTMSNRHLRDTDISWQAKGMLSFMLSNSDTFNYSIQGLTQCATNGDSSVRSILKELKDAGYLHTHPVTNERGQITNWDYDIFEVPHDEYPVEEIPVVENPHVENQPQRNTNINNHLNNSSSPINSPTTPIKNEIKKSKTNKRRNIKELSFEFLDEPENALWASAMCTWFDYKREIGDMYKTQHGVEGALDDLKAACDNDPSKAASVITFCIKKEWKGIYKPKELSNGTSSSNSKTGEPDLSKLTSQQRILYFAEQMHNARIAEQRTSGC